MVDSVGLTFTSFGRTGAHCRWQPAYFRLPCAGSPPLRKALPFYLREQLNVVAFATLAYNIKRSFAPRFRGFENTSSNH